MFNNFALEQWNDVVDDTNQALELGVDTVPDVYLFQGMAQCVLGNYAEAEDILTQGIELDPDYLMFYLLRAETRRQQGFLRLADAGADTGRLLSSDQSHIYAPIIERMLDPENQLGCADFMDLDFSGPTEVESTQEAGE
jgi:tetratricopeptide (TPR) repeat protein